MKTLTLYLMVLCSFVQVAEAQQFYRIPYETTSKPVRIPTYQPPVQTPTQTYTVPSSTSVNVTPTVNPSSYSAPKANVTPAYTNPPVYNYTPPPAQPAPVYSNYSYPAPYTYYYYSYPQVPVIYVPPVPVAPAPVTTPVSYQAQTDILYGVNLYEAGEYKKAIAHFNERLTPEKRKLLHSTTEATARQFLGYCYVFVGDESSAMEQFRIALTLNPFINVSEYEVHPKVKVVFDKVKFAK